jgi:beta-1,4-N-acetylglucosaminyltransferase
MTKSHNVSESSLTSAATQSPLHSQSASNVAQDITREVYEKTLFVTVGTTLFEDLMQAVTTPEALQWLIDHSYRHWIFQYGKGRRPCIPDGIKSYIEAKDGEAPHVTLDMYDFKPSLRADMEKADLIVSHAGAGTVQELLQLVASSNDKAVSKTADETATSAGDVTHSTLQMLSRHGRRCMVPAVVINNKLMHNHQCELAHALGDRGHLFVVESPEGLTLTATWDAMEAFVPEVAPPGDSYEFPALLNDFMGLSISTNRKSKDA